MAKIEPLEGRRLLTTLPSGFAESLVTDDVELPTAMAVAPDGRIFVAQQSGELRVVKNGQLLSSPFVDLSVELRGERGLVGVTLDPNFSSNGYVYLFYTVQGTTANRISRFTASGDRAASGSERVLFQLDASGGEASIHQGGAMAFGRDGKLYVAVGDHGGRIRAQQLTNQVGKILRLNPDGSIPTDNPFYDETTGKNKAIWARGLRNPYTMDIHEGTGRMYINDVGENTWEEINEGRAGANYGWPESEGPTTDSRFDAPVYAYHHTEGRAIVGGTFYNPPAGAVNPFPSSYAGDYLFMDFDKRWMRRFDVGSETATVFAEKMTGKVVDVDVAPDGSIYYLSRQVIDVSLAGVRRIHYTGSAAPSIGTHPTSRTVSVGQSTTFTVSATGTGTLSYQWQRNGVNIPGATASSYRLASPALADSGARFRAVVTNAAGNATSNSATLTVTANRAPTASITSPSSTARFSGGTVINYAGAGTDPENGTLPASAFTWRVELHHDEHSHPFLGPITNTKSGSFTIPRTGELSPNVWYRIHLSVRDANGLTHSTVRDVQPNRATVTLATSVPGLRLTLDGTPVTAPHSVLGVAGMTRAIGAPATQVLNGTTYAFVSWSDGGSATHNVNFPSSNRTYTATYRAVTGTTTRTLGAVADGYVWNGSMATRNFGSAGQLVVKSTGGELVRHSYLKFDLRTLGNVGTAKLRLFGRFDTASSSDGVTTGVFAASNTSWTESGLTWNNRPSIGSTPLATKRVTGGAARWHEWDLTSYLRQQKAAGKTFVTLVLRNTVNTKPTTIFNSDEAASNKPQLVVTG